jgi:predicted MPP superfamily phosphohydrolase
LPFIGGVLRPKGAKIFYDEYYSLENTKLYISSGIGTNKFKFRFNNRPSFNLYRLKK